jgi:hypothetical protein
MYHSALTLSHAFMSAGTTSDAFLRQNLDFLSRANNWSKFTATSALGVINKGSLSRGRTLLGPYLPSASAGAGPSQQGKEFSEGGALFAVGLVNAGRGGEECDWLVGQMKAAEDEVVKHGAALGLGVAGMASGSEGPSHLFLSNRCQVSLADATSSISCAEIYDILRETLFQDSAVAGEASGYAMGLVMLGSGSAKCFDEMVQYAHETQHEKIIRGLALGMAFLWYGKEEEADPFIARLAKDKVRSSTLLLALPLSLKRGAKLTFVVVVSTGTGRHPSVRCHVHDCACLRRHVQQHGDPPAARRGRLGRLGRRPACGRQRPRLRPLPVARPSAAHRSASQRELQPPRPAGRGRRARRRLCWYRTRGA